MPSAAVAGKCRHFARASFDAHHVAAAFAELRRPLRRGGFRRASTHHYTSRRLSPSFDAPPRRGLALWHVPFTRIAAPLYVAAAFAELRRTTIRRGGNCTPSRTDPKRWGLECRPRQLPENAGTSRARASTPTTSRRLSPSFDAHYVAAAFAELRRPLRRGLAPMARPIHANRRRPRQLPENAGTSRARASTPTTSRRLSPSFDAHYVAAAFAELRRPLRRGLALWHVPFTRIAAVRGGCRKIPVLGARELRRTTIRRGGFRRASTHHYVAAWRLWHLPFTRIAARSLRGAYRDPRGSRVPDDCFVVLLSRLVQRHSAVARRTDLKNLDQPRATGRSVGGGTLLRRFSTNTSSSQ
jgi:hypothetical protein